MFFGGLPIQKDEEVLKNNCPHIVVGTPGRILALVRSKKLNLKSLKYFILDECDKMLEQLGNSIVTHCHYAATNCLILVFRHAKRHPGYFPRFTSREASYDVQRHTEQGNPTSLQEIHARCKSPIFIL